jgi:hypothetical protein
MSVGRLFDPDSSRKMQTTPRICKAFLPTVSRNPGRPTASGPDSHQLRWRSGSQRLETNLSIANLLLAGLLLDPSLSHAQIR